MSKVLIIGPGKKEVRKCLETMKAIGKIPLIIVESVEDTQELKLNKLHNYENFSVPRGMDNKKRGKRKRRHRQFFDK